MAKSYSFLGLVDICDNFHIGPLPANQLDEERVVPFTLTSSQTSPAIGLVKPAVLSQLRAEIERTEPTLCAWQIHDFPKPRLSFAPIVSTPSARTTAMKELCERWRDTGLFEDTIGPRQWRDEMYPVYRNPFGLRDMDNSEHADTGNYAFEMERAACALFGVVTYGVHMTIYEDSSEDGLKIWVPTRAKSKQTWGGYLDNSVAGGIPSGMLVFETLVKESMEEASMAEEVIRKFAKAVGSVSYFTRAPIGWLQPKVQYVYDLHIPSGVDPAAFTPKPLDGEVESFDLLPVNQVIAKMQAGLFKPNCALVLVDFLIRHGHITPDIEPDYMQIITRLHGKFDYDKWLIMDDVTVAQ